MKTAETIERQESRNEDEKRANSPRFPTESSSSVSSTHARYGDHRSSSRGSGSQVNPAIPAAVQRSMLPLKLQGRCLKTTVKPFTPHFRRSCTKGGPYASQVLSDRAFGKLKETHAIERSPYKDLSDEELEAKIKELEQKPANDLGYVKVEPKTLPRADDPKLQ